MLPLRCVFLVHKVYREGTSAIPLPLSMLLVQVIVDPTHTKNALLTCIERRRYGVVEVEWYLNLKGEQIFNINLL